MSTAATIPVVSPKGQTLNGLGMMVSQYLEQDFAEFPHKVRAASKIRCAIALEMDKGVAVTISFLGDWVMVENGVGARPDLHIKGSYLVLSGVLCGKVNPVVGVWNRSIHLVGLPRKPFQALRVMSLLKIRPEASAEGGLFRRRRWPLLVGGSIAGLAGLAVLLWLLR
ncbi:MAG: hypothetical protein HY900_06335 [Deltaproteobacteria bacterium]|nr:hypothetical protein [Deltaproteobacteria bacterium]